MPPLPKRNLWKLVRKLGANTEPGERAEALAVIVEGCKRLHGDFRVAIVAVGAIPLLVHLLGPGSSAKVQRDAARTLVLLARDDESGIGIAAAGAIPPLVRLLGPASSAEVQQYAASALSFIALNSDNVVTIASAGAIPLLVQMLGPASPVWVEACRLQC
jgi:hypothetical protein